MVHRMILFAYSLFVVLVVSSPMPQSNDQGQNAIVFNVWQFARVTGGQGQRPPPPPPVRRPAPRPPPRAPAVEPKIEEFDTGLSEDAPNVQEPPLTAATPAGPCASACVGAIISCCTAPTIQRRQYCFDTLNCSGAWITNLCSTDMLKRVLATCA